MFMRLEQASSQSVEGRRRRKLRILRLRWGYLDGGCHPSEGLFLHKLTQYRKARVYIHASSGILNPLIRCSSGVNGRNKLTVATLSNAVRFCSRVNAVCWLSVPLCVSVAQGFEFTCGIGGRSCSILPFHRPVLLSLPPWCVFLFIKRSALLHDSHLLFSPKMLSAHITKSYVNGTHNEVWGIIWIWFACLNASDDEVCHEMLHCVTTLIVHPFWTLKVQGGVWRDQRGRRMRSKTGRNRGRQGTLRGGRGEEENWDSRGE